MKIGHYGIPNISNPFWAFELEFKEKGISPERVENLDRKNELDYLVICPHPTRNSEDYWQRIREFIETNPKTKILSIYITNQDQQTSIENSKGLANLKHLSTSEFEDKMWEILEGPK